MSRNAVLTRSVGQKWDCLGLVTSDTMSNYAHKIKADFININNIFVHHSKNRCIVFEKFQLYDLLTVYDRVMLVDFDAIISNHCPDIFKIVPEGMLGVSTHHLIGEGFKQAVREQLDDIEIDWQESKYWDSGVIVASRAHRDIFEYKEQPQLEISCAEERTFNYRIYKHKIPICELGHIFHYQPGHERDARWKDILDPFIIHWAGGGRGGKEKVLAKAERMKSDIANYSAWKEAGFPKQWE